MSEQVPNTDVLHGQKRNVDQMWLLMVTLFVCVTGAGVGFLLVAPSWKPEHNMESQPYYKPYAPSEVFADGMSERPLEDGVVPRPADQSPGIPYVAVRYGGPANFPESAPSKNIPVPITRELLERGQEQFNINCSECHSTAGDGDGMIVRRGFYSPPSFYLPRLRQQDDAHFYNVMTNGYGTMFSYAERVTPENRWAITAYIRALQIAVHQHPDLEQRLQKERGMQTGGMQTGGMQSNAMQTGGMQTP